MLSAGLNLIMSALKGQPGADSPGLGSGFGADAGTSDGFAEAFLAAEAMTQAGAGPFVQGTLTTSTAGPLGPLVNGADLPPGGADLPLAGAEPAPQTTAFVPDSNESGLAVANASATTPSPGESSRLANAAAVSVVAEQTSSPSAQSQPQAVTASRQAASSVAAALPDEDAGLGTARAAATRVTGDGESGIGSAAQVRPGASGIASVEGAAADRFAAVASDPPRQLGTAERAAVGRSETAVPADAKVTASVPGSGATDSVPARATLPDTDPRLPGRGNTPGVSASAAPAPLASPSTVATTGVAEQAGLTGAGNGSPNPGVAPAPSADAQRPGLDRTALETARLAARNLAQSTSGSPESVRRPSVAPGPSSERSAPVPRPVLLASESIDLPRTASQAAPPLDAQTRQSPLERKDLLRALQVEARASNAASTRPTEADDTADPLSGLIRRLTAADAALESVGRRADGTGRATDTARATTNAAAGNVNNTAPVPVQGESVPVREASLLADAFASTEQLGAEPDAPETGRTGGTRGAEGSALQNHASGGVTAPATGAARPAAAPSASAMAFTESLQSAPDTPEFPDELMGQVRLARMTGQQEVRLNLHPAELGRLTITINSEGDSARVNFLVDNQQARDALESNLPRLRDLFEQSGLQLDDANVSDQQYGAAGGDGERELSQQPSRMQADGDEQAASAETAVSRQPDRAGLFDAYA